ncbi:MAG: WD40 repeat domain-containing protein [Hyphomicrobiales bacterium]|nr:WD40 repeat domain-containing protein [Hyphomicrobiales bacterium]
MSTIANLEPGAYTQWAGFLNDIPTFADAKGFIRLVDGKEKSVDIHDGLLCAASDIDGKSLVSGGEDGMICRLYADGSSNIVHQAETKWIDKIATGPAGTIAYGSGRRGKIILKNDDIREINIDRTIEGLAFAPKGMRLAISRYDGIELQWINSDSPNQFLQWKGAHTGVMFSPDGTYVISLMQENALHGWRLRDKKHMQMTGYPSKVSSMSWSHKGKWLGTSGAQAAIIWPFSGKDGPMGKAPRELGGMGKVMVTQVCFHPTAEMLAVGYENGMIMAVRIDDGQIVSLRREGHGTITAMNWDEAGTRLAFGSDEGEAGIITLS